jgi:hypothetical protein
MSKLEDIPKNDFFKVPEGYFEKLPSVIHSRTIGEQQGAPATVRLPSRVWYAVAFVLVLCGIFWYTTLPTSPDAEKMLAEVETADLIAYLIETEITTEEMVFDPLVEESELDQLESEVYDITVDENTYEDLTIENYSDTL